MVEINKIYNVDCLQGMKDIEDKSIDMILTDLPYGQTARNKWDTVIPFVPLWEQYHRITKDNAAIVLFANGMFTADLMASNKKNWRYNLIWNKVMTTGFLNANKMPLRQHEDICVFYRSIPIYNPQKFKGAKSHSKGTKLREDVGGSNYNEVALLDNAEEHGEMKFPTSILTFDKVHPSKALHPTQKPTLLLEYLVKTYTDPNQVVLDTCMGSGSTAAACINTERKYIGFESDPSYYEIANKRIEEINGR